MKRMKALGVVEWHLTRRQAIYYLLSIGMPTAFYLFFSGMYQDTPGGPANFMRDYLISMTAFSMMSTAMFSFPAVLHTDKINNWQKNSLSFCSWEWDCEEEMCSVRRFRKSCKQVKILLKQSDSRCRNVIQSFLSLQPNIYRARSVWWKWELRGLCASSISHY